MKKQTKTFGEFMKRNAVYLVLALCIIAIGVATTFMLVDKANSNNAQLNNQVQDDPNKPVDNPDIPSGPDEPVDNPQNPDQPVVNPGVETIVFVSPVESATSVVDYSDTMVFNSTLGRYSAHRAIDFFAPEGSEVLAVYKGTVKSVESSILHGVTVTIDHGNGLVTVYNSLANADDIFVGASVEQGDVIGHVSVTNRQEYKDGAHLHFEVMENGEIIDPAKYLVLEEK